MAGSLGRYAGRQSLRVHGLGSVTRARRRATVGLVARPTAYRLERPGEEGEVRAVVRAAFGDEEGVDRIVDDLRGSDAWTGLSYVAEYEGRVVGHVSFTRSLLDAPNRLLEVLVLSPLSVLARGYAVCWNDDRSTVVRRASQVAAGDRVRVRLSEGELQCEVRETDG